MLSTHSFNALLKTLEEPPPHVKFLLATTDPQKLPVTVLSRCLQFNLKRLPVGADRRAHAPHPGRGGRADRAAARCALVAQAADGSMRDGLSLLDQLIAFGGGKAGEAEARAMLGTIARDHVVQLARAAGRRRCQRAAARRARRSRSSRPTTRRCSMSWRRCWCGSACSQAVKDYEGDELYAPEVLRAAGRRARPRGRAALLPDRDHRPARPGARARSAQRLRDDAAAHARVPARRRTPAARAAPAPRRARARAPPRPAPRGRRRAARRIGARRPRPGEPAAWAQHPRRSSSSRGAARQLASHCVLIGRQGARGAPGARSAQPAGAHRRRRRRSSPRRCRSYFGEPVRLEFDGGAGAVETPARRRGARSDRRSSRRRGARFEADPAVQGLRERFGATVLPETVRPVK